LFSRNKQAFIAPTAEELAYSMPVFVVPRLMRIRDAARHLSATTWQIETLLREKTIPSFVLSKRRVVDRIELDRYVERRKAEIKESTNAASEGKRACLTQVEFNKSGNPTLAGAGRTSIIQ
jgi:hypothetical protein